MSGGPAEKISTTNGTSISDTSGSEKECAKKLVRGQKQKKREKKKLGFQSLHRGGFGNMPKNTHNGEAEGERGGSPGFKITVDQAGEDKKKKLLLG